MKLITIGQLDKYIFIPIIGGLFKLAIKFLLKNSNEDNYLEEHPLILSISSSLGMSLSFIFLIIHKTTLKNNKKQIMQKKIKKENKNKSLSLELEYNDQFEAINYNKYKFFLLTSVLDIGQTILSFYFYYFIELKIWFCDILFLVLFSYLIFKRKLYFHHYICMILIVFTGFTLDIGKGTTDYIKNDWKKITMKFIGEILISLIAVINEYTIEKIFVSAYEICFYQGIISFSFYIILLLISIIFNIKLEDDQNYFDNFNPKILLSFLGVMMLLFGYNLCFFLTIENISLFHIMIIIIIGELYPYVSSFPEDKFEYTIRIICFVFMFVVILIFTEVIEINCCGMQKNTKRNISLRANKEASNIENDEDENDGTQFNEESDVNDSLIGIQMGNTNINEVKEDN